MNLDVEDIQRRLLEAYGVEEVAVALAHALLVEYNKPATHIGTGTYDARLEILILALLDHLTPLAGDEGLYRSKVKKLSGLNHLTGTKP